MSFTYNQFVVNLANMLVVPVTDPGYVIALPSIIDDTDQRLYRGLDLLSQVVRDSSGALTPNSRSFTFPQTFVVCESINYFTPAGSTTTRNQLVATSREFIDAVWGNEAVASTPSLPTFYAPITDQTIIVGPPPDAAYRMEVVGTVRPAPLSVSNQTTWLTTNLPDLYFAGAMVFGAAYQQNFSAMSDNPQQGINWETHFLKLFESANTEETRRKYAAQAWTAKQPMTISTPPRA